jgi:ADP-ribose pyrophosphatase YjhB (NUDIX family)
VAQGIPLRLRGAGLWVVDGHILMESTRGHDLWGVVGGGVEAGESADQACEREFREEVGVDVRCQRLAIVADIVIGLGDTLHREFCFYFAVAPVRDVIGIPRIASQELGLEFAWIPLAELGRVALVPPTLDVLIPRALVGDTALYVTYDRRVHEDERQGTRIWP